MDGSNVSLVIPICHSESQLLIHNLSTHYSSIQNVELIFVLNSLTNTWSSEGQMVLVTERWGNIYEAHTIGMRKSSREVILFLDKNQSITVSTIEKFLQPIFTNKADAVLNNMDYEYRKKRYPKSALIFPLITNYFINQADLKINTFMFLPYALTREILEGLKIDTLDNPVATYLKLQQNKIRLAAHLPIRSFYKLKDIVWTQSESQVVNYHLQAYAQCLRSQERADFSDGGRRIDLLTGLLSGNETPIFLTKTNCYVDTNSNLSIIIPAQNEEKCMRRIITECKKLDPLEIIIVVNGSSDRTASIAEELGATVIVYKDRLGLDVGRAIGAYFSLGEILLFIDGDFVIPANDLKPFVEAIEQGVDVALNNQNDFSDEFIPAHPVSACKYALNIACQRGDLGMSSTVAIPHAYSRRCLETIGYESLANPALSYAKALVNDFTIEHAHQVNVNKINRFRPSTHYRMQKDRLALTTSVIVGDHVEALHYLSKVCYLSTKGDVWDER